MPMKNTKNTSKMRRLLGILFLILLLACSGCGKSKKDSGADTAAVETEAGEESAAEDTTAGGSQTSKKKKVPKAETTAPAAAETTAAETTKAPSAAEKATTVTFACLYNNGMEYGLISGISASGQTVWQIRTEEHEPAQLTSVSEIGSYFDIFYYSDNGTAIAVNIADGTEVWRNSEFGGYACSGAFSGNGIVYLCGYLGPDLMVIDTDGSTIKRIDSFDSDYYWPFSMTYQGTENRLAMEFEGTPSGDVETVYVSLDDWSTSIDKSSGSSAKTSDPMKDIARISASSYLDEPQYNITHGPANVNDGSLSTAWVEGVSGNGEGESITITLNSDHVITGFTINAGYQKSDSLYSKNARPKAITVTFSGGSRPFVTTLNDTNGKQTVEFDQPVTTDSITITIDSVYKGSKYQDTAISEISLY